MSNTHPGSWQAGSLLCGLLGLLACAGCGQKAMPAAAADLPQVKVANAIQKDVPITSDWVGTLEGYVNAQIQPQVTGYLIQQDYREGTFVHKGDVLFEIDPRPFQAALDQANAQLAQAKAQLGAAALNVKRDIPEAQAEAIPQSQLDNDTQAKLAAQAAVEAAQASVEQAQLNLGYTKVHSLIDGIAGIAQVQVGNLVSPTTVLTGVSQVDPIKAYFEMSEADWLRMAGKIETGGSSPSSSHPIPLHLILPNGEEYSYPGRTLFADRAMNLQTGTIQIVGSFPNPQRVLRPQETATVRAVTEVLERAILIPQLAVAQLQGSYQVAVVGPDNRVNVRNVAVGPQVGMLWVISHGISPNERVIVQGADKVRTGMTVRPQPYSSTAGDD